MIRVDDEISAIRFGLMLAVMVCLMIFVAQHRHDIADKVSAVVSTY